MGVAAGWYMLSALLQQGSNTYPISTAARVIYWVGYSVSLIVYTSYSATLVSHLAVEQPAPLPFSNLRDLSRQSGWDAGCNNNDLFQVIALGCSQASTDTNPALDFRKPDGGKLRRFKSVGTRAELNHCAHKRSIQLWTENEDRESKREHEKELLLSVASDT
ncbi:uncharacterized protein LOC135099599 [Scylla paramamosain]|uniref:uncharacterized protein LOC135099599 n=1 Tax=Scylla paramamosain TaxID=85552 RepID=UPI003082A0ED